MRSTEYETMMICKAKLIGKGPGRIYTIGSRPEKFILQKKTSRKEVKRWLCHSLHVHRKTITNTTQIFNLADRA